MLRLPPRRITFRPQRQPPERSGTLRPTGRRGRRRLPCDPGTRDAPRGPLPLTGRRPGLLTALGSNEEDRDVEGVGTPSLAIIGAGRAGSALAIASHDSGYRIAAVASRRGEMAARLADTVGAQA